MQLSLRFLQLILIAAFYQSHITSVWPWMYVGYTTAATYKTTHLNVSKYLFVRVSVLNRVLDTLSHTVKRNRCTFECAESHPKSHFVALKATNPQPLRREMKNLVHILTDIYALYDCMLWPLNLANQSTHSQCTVHSPLITLNCVQIDFIAEWENIQCISCLFAPRLYFQSYCSM